MKERVNEKGQSLFEVVISLAVIAVIGYSLFNLSLIALRSSRLAANRSTASAYSREIHEVFREQRDSGNWGSFIEGLSLNVLYCMDANNTPKTDCYSGTTFNPSYLAGTVFEKLFVLSEVNRENTSGCPEGCSACGDISATSINEDNCTIKLTTVVAFPAAGDNCDFTGISGSRYCIITSTYLTRWK